MKVDWTQVNKTKDGTFQVRCRHDVEFQLREMSRGKRPQTIRLDFASFEELIGFACEIIKEATKLDQVPV